MDRNKDEPIYQVLLPRLQDLLASRDHPKTICPSEVARSLDNASLRSLDADSWRDMMDPLRTLINDLRSQGDVEVLQRGQVIPTSVRLDDVKGPIRIRRTKP